MILQIFFKKDEEDFKLEKGNGEKKNRFFSPKKKNIEKKQVCCVSHKKIT